MDTIVSAPAQERVELGLTGMTCAACAARIEKSLNRLPGVTAAVNFATETAAVGFDPARASTEVLLAQVAKAGYGATVRTDPAKDRAADQARKSAELAALRREFIVAAILTLPFLVQMVPMLLNGSLFGGAHEDLIPRPWQLALATPVQFWIGRRFYIGAWHALRGGGANMDVLVALGTSMAYLWSVVVTLFGWHHEHVYFEASAAVITLVLLGKLLEARAKAGTSAALEGLLRLQPSLAHVLRDGAITDVPLASVIAGDRFVVRAGERIPVDGVVRDGASSVDESMLTGESAMNAKSAGGKVFAGTLNQDGTLTCEATGVGGATLLAGIVVMAANDWLMRSKVRTGWSMACCSVNGGRRFARVRKRPTTWQARMRSMSMTGVLLASDSSNPCSTACTMLGRLGRGSSSHICDFMAKAWVRSCMMLEPSP